MADPQSLSEVQAKEEVKNRTMNQLEDEQGLRELEELILEPANDSKFVVDTVCDGSLSLNRCNLPDRERIKLSPDTKNQTDICDGHGGEEVAQKDNEIRDKLEQSKGENSETNVIETNQTKTGDPLSETDIILRKENGVGSMTVRFREDDETEPFQEMSELAINKLSDITTGPVKTNDVLKAININTCTIQSTSDRLSPNAQEELVKISKFNCVLCEQNFRDLTELESHVKSHDEVLHFSILLKQIGKENEEKTRNVLSSLIDLAKSFDINLSKFGNLFRSEAGPKKKYLHNTANRRRKGRPRKKQVECVESDICEDNGDAWNGIDDVDDEDNDPTFTIDKQEEIVDNVDNKKRRRGRKRNIEKVHWLDENKGDDLDNFPKENEVDTKDTKTIKEENKSAVITEQNTKELGATDEWKSIEDLDFKLVKKEGPGRPAYGMECPICDKFITGRTRLKLHMRKEHGKFKGATIKTGLQKRIKHHSCEVCGQQLRTFKRLKAHLLDKHQVSLSSNAKMYKCPLCDAFFGRRSELKEHRNNSHPGQSEHICTMCGKMLMTASLLEKHMRNHTGEKPFKCDLCPKAFTINTKLQEHIRQHTGERPFVCEICGAKFNRSCNKKRHMLIHEGKFPHTCEICGKGFRDIGPLTLHIRRHTGDKPYKCEDSNCNMAFITRGELLCHQAKHTQKREHLCSLCGAEFLYKGDLRRHVKLHSGERPYKCSDCNAAFTRNQHLKHHWQSHHALGARHHKEWKPRKKPEQFGLPKQSSLLATQSQPCVTSVSNTSTVQGPSQFHPDQQQQQQQQQQHNHQQQQQQHQQENIICAVCNQWFPSEGALKAHSIIHTMETDHMFVGMATSCRQEYNPLSGIPLNNLATSTQGSVDVCTMCNVIITEPGSLQLHLQNIHGQYT